MLVAYLTVSLVFSTFGAIAPLIQKPPSFLFHRPMWAFLCLILHLIAQKITNTKKLAKVFVNEISLPPPLFRFHTHICNGLHLYELFLFPPRHITVMWLVSWSWNTHGERCFMVTRAHTPPHTTPLPPHTFPHNLLEEYRICTSVRISLLLPSPPRASCHLIFL